MEKQSFRSKTTLNELLDKNYGLQQVKRTPITYERNLIASLIHSKKLYDRIKDTICPWDGGVGFRSSDFDHNPFNVLYDAISVHWDRAGTHPVEGPIPQTQLEAILIDWANNGSIALDMIERVLDEVREDMYKMAITDDFIETNVMGESFQAWSDQRLGLRVAINFNNRIRSTGLTLSMAKQIVDSTYAFRLKQPSKARNLADLVQSVDVEHNTGELLKHRFLCRKGGLLIVGATGIGKSTLAAR